MKTTLLFLSIVISIIVPCQIQAQNPVPNKGFENWTMGDPNNWTTNNAGTSWTTISKGAGAMGMWSAKGERVQGPSSVISPVLTSINSVGSGFPVSQLYNSLSFYYQFVRFATAEFDISVALFNNSTVVASATTSITVPQNSWMHMTMPITDHGLGIPNTCIINFLIDDAAPNPTVGDYYMVDEVELSGASSVSEINSTGLEKLSPNPVDDFVSVYYAVAESGPVDITISDMLGKVVLEQHLDREAAGRHKVILPTSELLLGQYLVTIQSGSGSGSLTMQVVR